ncbi:hypothetical protein HUO13_22265 [Saccharopolyspora erythraea]|uniref:hypothetical protein n=1 Tax=Saccharopolyspora erythraea TaxID=1836 RepID=UPI001BA928BF|nr:hypothetical protein [Saccharopolyspora erythraea]QUH03185.1 hypothetical protein HUO13_22265 [Saccharopolyspora erythraea]
MATSRSPDRRRGSRLVVTAGRGPDALHVHATVELGVTTLPVDLLRAGLRLLVGSLVRAQPSDVPPQRPPTIRVRSERADVGRPRRGSGAGERRS